jgi:replicative DNA helicase
LSDKFGKSFERHLEVEMKVIHLMLRHRDAVDELLNDGYRVDFFETVHRPLVQAIYEEYVRANGKRLLTRNGYQEVIKDQDDKKNLVPRMNVYDKCDLKVYADRNELGYLKKLLMEGFAGRALRKYLQQANVDADKKGFMFAIKTLRDNLDTTLVNTETKDTVFASFDELKDSYLEQLEYDRSHPETIITCNIPEVDNAINVGFRPMHLTLVVADVGGHKTNLMLNIALNVSEQGHNVLFVPLEMPWRDLTSRVICNRVNINNRLLAKPHLLKPEQIQQIKEASLWENKHFAVLDAHERFELAVLRREIEKRVIGFQPKVVVIDYADIVRTEARYQSRTIEIGEMLHSLRALGKQYGFHIVSAAQMNRAAIKALREGDDSALDSTAIHGSHNYSAASDTIFGLMRIPDEKDKIKIYVIKARHGPSGVTGELNVDPSRYLITSTSETLTMTSETDLELDLNRPPSEIAAEVEKVSEPMSFQGCDLDDLDSLASDPLADL